MAITIIRPLSTEHGADFEKALPPILTKDFALGPKGLGWMIGVGSPNNYLVFKATWGLDPVSKRESGRWSFLYHYYTL